MKLFKKLAKKLAPYVLSTAIAIGSLFAFSYNLNTPETKINSPDSLFYKTTRIEKKITHRVEKGQSLWSITKQYLKEGHSNKEIKDKILKIQELSSIKANKYNDNMKYVNGKRVKGSDGLVDLIKPGQELVIDIRYENIAYKINSETSNIDPVQAVSYEQENNNNYYWLIPAVLIPVGVGVLLNKRRKFPSKEPISKKRFSMKYVRNQGLDEKLSFMLERKRSYKEVKEFINNDALMNISKSTYYRYRKTV
jgi:LysM repeat protein